MRIRRKTRDTRVVPARIGTTLVTLALGILASFQATARPRPCQSTTFENARFTVCRYTAARDDLMLVSHSPRGPIGSLSKLETSLGARAAAVDFAMNAGMYDEARRPVGLFVESFRTIHPLNRSDGTGNFFLKPNGVFWLDAVGVPHVEETESFAVRHPPAKLATQSGPLLVRSGRLNPRIADDGPSLTLRNGVGVRGGQAVFVISDDPVSFGRFARFIRDGLGMTDALYFDGAVSSLWVPAMDRQDARDGLATFVVATRRRTAPPKPDRQPHPRNPSTAP